MKRVPQMVGNIFSSRVKGKNTYCSSSLSPLSVHSLASSRSLFRGIDELCPCAKQKRGGWDSYCLSFRENEKRNELASHAFVRKQRFSSVRRNDPSEGYALQEYHVLRLLSVYSLVMENSGQEINYHCSEPCCSSS